MMALPGFSQLILYFTIYSVLGWILETVYSSIHMKRYVNRGFFNGPYCPVYGVGAVLILLATVFTGRNPFVVFLTSLVLTAALEYVAGWLVESLFGLRLWDYSGRKLQLRGRVWLPVSLLFGAMGLGMIYLLHPQVERLVGLLAPGHQRVLASVIIVLFVLDLLRTLGIVTGLGEKLSGLHSFMGELERYQDEYEWFDKNDLAGSMEALRAVVEETGDPEAEALLTRLDELAGHRDAGYRVLKAYPAMKPRNMTAELEELRRKWAEEQERLSRRARRGLENLKAKNAEIAENPKSFAGGINFYKLVWVFTIASVLGYLIETAFCLVTTGTVESRQGMIYGPFNQVYGFGAVLMVLILHPLAARNDRWLFLGGMAVGGVFEFFCSWVQEKAFGTVSWEYSHQPFSFGGRTSLLFMFFWGVLGLVYIKEIYPRLSNLIERIPRRQGVFFSWVLVITLSANMLLSAVAVARWTDRRNGVPAGNAAEEYLDRRYPDEMLEEIYPNMMPVAELDRDG